MSESETETPGIDDEQLPDDLQPGEDNPLAEPLDDDVDPAELDLFEGKQAEQSEPDRAGQPDQDTDGASEGTP